MLRTHNNNSINGTAHTPLDPAADFETGLIHEEEITAACALTRHDCFYYLGFRTNHSNIPFRYQHL